MAGGTGGYGYALAYAPNGDLAAANDSVNGNWAYTYDDFGRLLTSVPLGKTWSYAYAYDRYGNRYQQNLLGTGGSGNTFSHTFDVNNHINDSTATYDAAGNVMWDGVHNYTYDAENRLTKVNSGTTATYLYDAGGQRVRKSSTAGTFDFVYDLGGREIAEVNSSDVWDRAEVYAGGKHLATYTGGTSGVTYFNHADWLGTERGRSNVAGSICETVTSLPFGDGLATGGSCGDPSPMHFTGQEHDPESNLDNFHARYDASSVGRFMSPDPVGGSSVDPQTLNKYAYVRNSPLSFTDPSGEVLELVGNISDDERALKEMAGSSAGDVGFQTQDGITTATFDCRKLWDCNNLSDSAWQIDYWVHSSSLFVFGLHSLGGGYYAYQTVQADAYQQHQWDLEQIRRQQAAPTVGSPEYLALVSGKISTETDAAKKHILAPAAAVEAVGVVAVAATGATAEATVSAVRTAAQATNTAVQDVSLRTAVAIDISVPGGFLAATQITGGFLRPTSIPTSFATGLGQLAGIAYSVAKRYF